MRAWLHLGLLWLVGIDLRITLLAVPPVLPQIHHDLVLNEKAVGALTGLPVLLLGTAAIGGSLLIAHLGARRAIVVGLLLVAIGGALRGAGPNVAVLFAMTLLMGLGVAISQPAAPTLVGAWFPRSIGFATAVYVNGILAGEALSAGLTIPFVLPWVGGSWGWSFVVWSAPVLLTALAVLLFVYDLPRGDDERVAWWPDWRSSLTWKLGGLQAGISILYFGLNAFIPDYFHATHRAWLAAACIATLNAAQLPGSFLTLLFAHRLAGRREFFIAVFVASIPGIAWMLGSSDWLAIAGVAIFGCCSAIGLAMIVALPPMLTPHADVHRLSAGMFTIGYLGSFAGTLIGGALWDASGIPATAFVPVAFGAAMVAAIGGTLRFTPVR
ncbi:MAG: MFS transporter [Candidatus Eremiobacteraeota bacterium]|nr:MFS transporter [Candidatus Eremiobacteraeota bacterium]